MKKLSSCKMIVSLVGIVLLSISFLCLSIVPSKALGKTQYKIVHSSYGLGPDGENILNQYSNDGWELVQAVYNGRSTDFILKK